MVTLSARKSQNNEPQVLKDTTAKPDYSEQLNYLP